MYCSQCGSRIEKEAKFCFKCGRKVEVPQEEKARSESAAAVAADRPYREPAESGSKTLEEDGMRYAGFWARVGAVIIDSVIWGAFSVAVAFLPIDEELYGVMGFFIAWMYYALLESSAWQGTIGKLAMGIAVTDMDGNRISFFRATFRYFFHLLSALTMMIGYLMAAFTPKKQALHDIVCRCMVLKK